MSCTRFPVFKGKHKFTVAFRCRPIITNVNKQTISVVEIDRILLLCSVKRYKTPIPLGYALLGGVVLGAVIGCRNLLWYVYWRELEHFRWDRGFFIHMVNYGTWALLLPLAYYFITNYKLNKASPFLDKTIAVTASLLLALLHEIISNVIYHGPLHFTGIEPMTTENFRSILFSIPIAMISRVLEYWVLYAMITALEYSRKYNDKRVELARLENQLSNAQLNALRLQLQPHFLFNTLNTISSLMEFNIKSAQKIVSKLGNLLRILLDKNKRNLIPLREELEFIRSYLEIERVRFMDRLQIRYQIDEQLLEAQVPGLILQPLVENAIKHGFGPNPGNGNISLDVFAEDHHLIMCIADDGAGSHLSQEELLNKGIGLKNVNERLRLLYGNRFSLGIQTATGQGFRVCLKIPGEPHF